MCVCVCACVRGCAWVRARVCVFICGCTSIIEAPPHVMLVESSIGIYREGWKSLVLSDFLANNKCYEPGTLSVALPLLIAPGYEATCTCV